jgi:hypothetical protein
VFTRIQRGDYASGYSLESPTIEEYEMKRTRMMMMTIALLGAVFALSACKQNQPNNTPPPASMMG